MHSCPDCGMACDCDGEDIWMDSNALGCVHDCDEDEDESWIFDDEVTWYTPHDITLSDRQY